MALAIERGTHASGAEVFRLAGQLTLGREAQNFERMITEAVAAGQRRIVVDLAGVPYVDSAGVGILVGCHSKMKEAGGQFQLAAAPERVRQIFRLAKVDAMLALHDTVDGAMA